MGEKISYKVLRLASNNLSPLNKIREESFGSIYKGINEYNKVSDGQGFLSIHMPAYSDSIIKRVSILMFHTPVGIGLWFWNLVLWI